MFNPFKKKRRTNHVKTNRELFTELTGREYTGTVMDVNSLYPAVMLKMNVNAEQQKIEKQRKDDVILITLNRTQANHLQHAITEHATDAANRGYLTRSKASYELGRIINEEIEAQS